MGIVSDALNGAKSIASQIAEAVGDALIDLGQFLNGDVPTSSLTAPSSYVPPFNGGQCTGVTYNVSVRRILLGNNGESELDYGVVTLGNIPSPIKQVSAKKENGNAIWFLIDGNNVQQNFLSIGNPSDRTPIVRDIAVVRADGLPDTCGSLPDPNPQSPQSNPVPISSAVGIGGASVVAVPDLFVPTPSAPIPPVPVLPPDENPPSTVEGIALALPSLLRNVAAALSSIKDIVDILNGIKDLIDKLSKKNGKKEVKLFPIGLAEGDGYINLSSIVSAGYVPYKVNILITTVPTFLTKEVTDRIPFNYYLGLGRIQSVDALFNICSLDRIQHIRQSVYLKDDVIGFYYSFGRERKVKAQLTVLAIKDDE